MLELLSRHDGGLTISELYRALQLPLSSAATIAYTLHGLGYLDRDTRSSRYRLSPKLHGMAERALDQLDIVRRCHEHLADLVRESGMTAHIAVLRGGESVYIDRLAGDGFVQFSTFIGMSWPAHTSGVGKALLAFLPEDELAAKWPLLELKKKFTNRTIRNRAALERQFRRFRRLGYAWEAGEGESAVGCVAAPIFGPRHKLIAAVSTTGTLDRLTRRGISELGGLVKGCARHMSVSMGDQA